MLVQHRLRFVKTSSFLSRQNLVDQTLSPKLDENIGILIWGERGEEAEDLSYNLMEVLASYFWGRRLV